MATILTNGGLLFWGPCMRIQRTVGEPEMWKLPYKKRSKKASKSQPVWLRVGDGELGGHISQPLYHHNGLLSLTGFKAVRSGRYLTLVKQQLH